MSAPPIIRAVGLTKRFGTFTAVDDLHFEVRRGSIFAFLGANGSGKSTTIRMLIGLLQPTAGSVDVDGIDVIRTPREVRDQIGYMGQRVSLYQGLSLRENLDFYAGLYGLAGQALERRWAALSERFALREVEHERAADLSAGVRQRAGLALSTLHQPRVLFLDEPTAGVDIENRLLFWELIQEEAAAGVTVFVTTHFLEEVDYCDWVCFIDSGRLIANATPDVIRARYSQGYDVTLALPPGSREAAVSTLAGRDRTITVTPAGVALRTRELEPELLATLATLTGPGTSGSVRIEAPSMIEVVRRLMIEGAATTAARDLAAPASDAMPVASTHRDARPHPRNGTRGLAASWQRLRTLMQREIRATLRDAFTVGILIAVPLAALLAFGYTLSTEVQGLRLGVHDASGTSASRRLVAELAANGTFTLRRFTNRTAIERALVAGDVSVAVIIPPDFDRQLSRGGTGTQRPQIQVLYDGGETVVAGNAEGSLRGLVAATGAGLVARSGETPPGRVSPGTGVEVITHALFNPRLDGTPFMVAGTFGFVLTFLTTLITAVSIVTERVTGTFEQLRVTPATAAEIVLGKILPLGAVFAFDVLLMVVTAGLVLGVWPAGSLLFFFAVSVFYVMISLALGLIFSATSATAAAAVQKTVLFSVPLIFLGGFAFPIRNMPWVFRAVAELVPASHYIRMSRAIYLRGEGPISLLPEIGMLLLFGTILMAIAFRAVASRA